MSRVVALALQIGILLGAVAGILYLVRIILQLVSGVGSWYWAGAMASFAAPLAFALALHFYERRDRSVSVEPAQ